MYLSLLTLNIRSRSVVHDQNNPYELHRTIMRAFSTFDHEQERVLFRLEGKYLNKLLVQSTLKPDWQPLIEKVHYLVKQPEIKPFEEFKFTKGQLLRFKLRANPVKRDSATRKRVALLKDEERIAWLIRKGPANGFSVDFDMASSHSANWRQFAMPVKDQRKRATLNIVDFQGVLRVKDENLLNQAVRSGIGPAKGLGCGMLTLARM